MSGSSFEGRISRRQFIVGTGAAVTSAALTSCGLGDTAPFGATMVPREPVGPSPEEYWSAGSYDDWMNLGVRSGEAFVLRAITTQDTESEEGSAAWEYALSEWNKIYPEATIQHASVDPTELETAIIGYASGSVPLDIGWSLSSAIAHLGDAGFVAPLNDLMPQWYWDTRLDALSRPPGAKDGPDEAYLAPIAMRSAAHIYRKDAWQAAGADPDGLKTWDDLLAACEAVRQDSEFSHPVGLYLADPGSTVDTIQWIFSGNGLRHEADFSDSDAYLECVSFMQELFQYVPEDSLEWDRAGGRRAYLSGQIGMLASDGVGLIDARGQDRAEVFNSDDTIARPFAGGPGNPFGEPFYCFTPASYLLMEATAHPQAVADFIACATTGEAALKLGPTVLPPSNDWTVDRRVETSSLKEGVGWWFEQWQAVHGNAGAWTMSSYLARAEVVAFFHRQVVRLFRGETTPQRVLQDVQEFAVPRIQEAEKAVGGG